MEEKLTILLLENAKEDIESILPQLVWRLLVHTIAVLQSATRQDGQPNTENFGETGVDMGGVGALLHEVIIDLLGCQVDDGGLILCL